MTLSCFFRRRAMSRATLLHMAATFLGIVLAICNSERQTQAAEQASRPNIVFLLADDLGYGGVGVYGQNARAEAGLPAVRTPHIDALAKSGMRFTQMYASATICSPSRASLFTGYHSGHQRIDRNGGFTGLLKEETTVADLLQSVGYTTGLFGKWGAGTGGTTMLGVMRTDGVFDPNDQPKVVDPSALPTRHGFEKFFGYISQSRGHNYRVDSLWHDDPTAEHGVGLVPTNGAYSHDLIAKESEKFIRDCVAAGKPFYLQASYTIPHARIDQVDDWEQFGDSSWPKSAKMMAAMLTKLDKSVGSLVDRLRDPNGDGNADDSVLENTVIVFSSDNGPHAEEGRGGTVGNNPRFFDENGPLRGIKRDLYEGGIRVPFIVRWDGHVAAGSVNETLIGSFEDFLPTACDLTGVAVPEGLDGVSIIPALTGKGTQQQRKCLVWEFHEKSKRPIWAIRQGKWKLLKLPNGEFELYDLTNDIGEDNNLVAEHPDVKEKLEAMALAEQVEAPRGASHLDRADKPVLGDNS